MSEMIKPLRTMKDRSYSGIVDRRDWGESYFDVVVYGEVYATGCRSYEFANALFARFWFLVN